LDNPTIDAQRNPSVLFKLQTATSLGGRLQIEGADFLWKMNAFPACLFHLSTAGERFRPKLHFPACRIIGEINLFNLEFAQGHNTTHMCQTRRADTERNRNYLR